MCIVGKMVQPMCWPFQLTRGSHNATGVGMSFSVQPCSAPVFLVSNKRRCSHIVLSMRSCTYTATIMLRRLLTDAWKSALNTA